MTVVGVDGDRVDHHVVDVRVRKLGTNVCRRLTHPRFDRSDADVGPPGRVVGRRPFDDHPHRVAISVAPADVGEPQPQTDRRPPHPADTDAGYQIIQRHQRLDRVRQHRPRTVADPHRDCFTTAPVETVAAVNVPHHRRLAIRFGQRPPGRMGVERIVQVCPGGTTHGEKDSIKRQPHRGPLTVRRPTPKLRPRRLGSSPAPGQSPPPRMTPAFEPTAEPPPPPSIRPLAERTVHRKTERSSIVRASGSAARDVRFRQRRQRSRPPRVWCFRHVTKPRRRSPIKRKSRLANALRPSPGFPGGIPAPRSQ